MNVETGIEPPGLSPDEDGDSRPSGYVHVSLLEPDGTQRTGSVLVPGDDPGDDRLAAALIEGVRGVATMRGPGLVAAVERRLR